MPMSVAGRNALLGALPSTLYVSMHTAQPNDSGSNELTGGTYARQSFTLAAASNGTRAASALPSAVNIPGGNTVTHSGFWSAVSGGTFYGYDQLDASETYSGDGTYTFTAISFSIT